MENASEALIIAGTILIAMIVLSIGVYLVVNYAQVGESYEQTRAETEITKFNTNFTVFEGRTDIKAQEIVTLYNFAQEYRENNGYTVTILGVSIGDDPAAFLKDNSNLYSCESITYGDDGRVTQILFRQNT